MRMQILDIITKKKLGQPLTREEITFFARGAADKTIPDYQLAALLMAIRLNGMTAQAYKSATRPMATTCSALRNQAMMLPAKAAMTPAARMQMPVPSFVAKRKASRVRLRSPAP